MKSTTQLAKKYGVSSQTIRNWIRKGKLEVEQVTKGGHFRIKEKIERRFIYARVSSKKQYSSIEEQIKLYKFKLKLKWYCQKYGKHLVDVDVDESYTSKTYSWNGFVDDKLKSKKVVKFQNMLIDRDINGARGILIKQLKVA